MQEFDALLGGPLKGFAAGDEACAAAPFVDHRGPYGLCEVPLAGRCAIA
ncbi:hypothetical protein [Streptomyces spiralis]